MPTNKNKSRLKVVIPNGTEMVRTYHRNMVSNIKNLQDPTINVPPLITRAKLVVRESREIIVRERSE